MFSPKAYQLRDQPYPKSLTVLSSRGNIPSPFQLTFLAEKERGLMFEKMS
jgi:hypothetical protein